MRVKLWFDIWPGLQAKYIIAQGTEPTRPRPCPGRRYTAEFEIPDSEFQPDGVILPDAVKISEDKAPQEGGMVILGT